MMNNRTDYNQLEAFIDIDRHVINAVIEVPSGSTDKIEWNSSSKKMIVDRVNPSTLPEPFNYGFIPRSLGGDKDNLDILILSKQVMATGSVVAARVIGVMFFIDDDQTDDKIVATLEDDLDENILSSKKADIEFYFNNYKRYQIGSSAKVIGWGDSQQAIVVIERACRDWQKLNI